MERRLYVCHLGPSVVDWYVGMYDADSGTYDR